MWRTKWVRTAASIPTVTTWTRVAELLYYTIPFDPRECALCKCWVKFSRECNARLFRVNCYWCRRENIIDRMMGTRADQINLSTRCFGSESWMSVAYPEFVFFFFFFFFFQNLEPIDSWTKEPFFSRIWKFLASEICGSLVSRIRRSILSWSMISFFSTIWGLLVSKILIFLMSRIRMSVVTRTLCLSDCWFETTGY